MWPYPRVLAHRGGGILAPENTIAALRCGRAYGFAGIEFDVMLAADGIPVLMHDPVFGRTVQASGRIADFSAAQLGAMDAGSWFGPAFNAEGVPTLRQALEECARESLWPNIEIKPGSGDERETGYAVAQLVKSVFAAELAPDPRDAASLPLLSSFSHEALLAAQEIAPEIPRALLVNRVPDDWQKRLANCGGIALHASQRFLSRRQARAVRDAGYGLFCYTVNDPRRAAELLEWGVDAFCTDRLDLIGPDFGKCWLPLPQRQHAAMSAAAS